MDSRVYHIHGCFLQEPTGGFKTHFGEGRRICVDTNTVKGFVATLKRLKKEN
jgi:hypothetical protein